MPTHQDPLAILMKQRLEAQETVRRLDEAIRVLENIGPDKRNASRFRSRERTNCCGSEKAEGEIPRREEEVMESLLSA